MRTIAKLTMLSVLLGAGAATAADFLIVYTLAPDVNLTALTPAQSTALGAHVQKVTELLRSGAVYTAGHSTTVDHPTGLAIVAVKDEAAARAIADGDPAVQAGLFKALVQPFTFLTPPVPPSGLVTDAKGTYDYITRYVLEAARKMPEQQYAFRPTPVVRTFAQILGHIAETQYAGCGAVRGETYTPHNFEQTTTTKAALIPALEAAFAYCGEAWAQTTDARAAERVALFGQQRTKLAVLATGTAHVFEHYGNLATYMRLKGLVPPTSEKSAPAASGEGR